MLYISGIIMFFICFLFDEVNKFLHEKNLIFGRSSMDIRTSLVEMYLSGLCCDIIIISMQ